MQRLQWETESALSFFFPILCVRLLSDSLRTWHMNAEREERLMTKRNKRDVLLFRSEARDKSWREEGKSSRKMEKGTGERNRAALITTD